MTAGMTMTATDPQLAAMPVARFAPSAEALVAAYAEDRSAGPQPVKNGIDR